MSEEISKKEEILKPEEALIKEDKKEKEKEEKEKKEEEKEKEEKDEKVEKEEKEKEEKEEKKEIEKKEEENEENEIEEKSEPTKKKKKNKKISKKEEKLSDDLFSSFRDEDVKKSESNSESGNDDMDDEEFEKTESKNEEDDEENDDEDDIDDDYDDDDDDDEDDVNSSEISYSDDRKKKDPHHSYINSKIEYNVYLDNLQKGDYLYGIEKNKFYKFLKINTKDSNNPVDKYNFILELVDNLKAKTKKGKNEMKKISENILYKSKNYAEYKFLNKKEEKSENKNLDINGEIKKENIVEENKKEKIDQSSNKEVKKKKKNYEKMNEGQEEDKEKEKKEVKEEKEEKEETKKKEENDKENEDKREDKEKDIENDIEKNNKENAKENDLKNDNNKEDKKDHKKNESNKEKEKEDNKEQNEKEKTKNELTKKKTKKFSANKKETISITIKDFSKYTNLQKIKIFYINYLNIFHRIDMIIDINCSINHIVGQFQKLYHIPCDRYSEEKPPLLIFINNKKYSPLNKNERKYFIPNKFDYKNDYLIFLEHETHKFSEIDMGTRNNYINLKGEKIPHFVFSSYYNLQIDGFVISKNITYLECEVYELKKELNFSVDPENEKATKKKAKEFLNLNWKEKSSLISIIKSGALRKSKENYDANCFEINREFILGHGKVYIFLVTSNNKKVYAFNPRRISKDGLVIISRDDKAILSGFKCKKISDLIAY